MEAGEVLARCEAAPACQLQANYRVSYMAVVPQSDSSIGSVTVATKACSVHIASVLETWCGEQRIRVSVESTKPRTVPVGQ